MRTASSLSDSDPLSLPIIRALRTSHAALAVTRGLASKYPSAIAPFASLLKTRPGASADLFSCSPREKRSFWKLPRRRIPGLVKGEPVPCVQMEYSEAAPLPSSTLRHSPLGIVPLSCGWVVQAGPHRRRLSRLLTC